MVELARLETGRGDHAAALTSLRRALAIAPNSEQVLRAHAEVSLAAGAPIATVWSLEPLTRMHPTVVEYPYLLGAARLQVGDSAGAVEALERALALAPRRPRTLVALGLAYNNQKRFTEAAEALAQALRLQPENPEAVAALAQAAEGMDRLEEAEQHARRALARVENHPLALQVIGMVRMKQGRYAEARDLLLQALEVNPDSVKARYQLSLAYARLGDRVSSQRQLELYREALARLEEALIELSTRTGTGMSGM
jgi:tetratricopeptide (TPR) repeat protein